MPSRSNADAAVVSRSDAIIGAAVAGICSIVVAFIGSSSVKTGPNKCQVDRTVVAILKTELQNQVSWIEKAKVNFGSSDQILRQQIMNDLEKVSERARERAAELDRTCG